MTGNARVFWLIVTLDGREYALPLAPVAQVLRMVSMTPTPEAPAWVPGVINVRGRITPIINLRVRLGLPELAPSLSTRIVVVHVEGRAVGLLADEVIEVLSGAAVQLAPMDALTGAAPPVLGTLHAGERLILALDLSRVCAGLAVTA